MGKGGRKQKKDTQTPKRRKRDDEFVEEEDMDDEIDAFHKQRDIVPLDADEDVGSSDEDGELPVLDFKGGDDDEDDEDDEDDDEDETRLTGFAAKIARQQKYLRQKTGGVDDEMDDDTEKEEEKRAVWGRRKNIYHGADNVDYEIQSSDEDLAEEEAEVLRLQKEKAKSLSKQDVGLEDSDQEASDSDRERTLEDLLPKKRALSKHHEAKEVEDDAVGAYEEIKKDLNALSKEEQMDVVYSSAPELVGLLSELNDALDQLENKVIPLLSKVKERNDITKEGMHYLEVKQPLLLAYCQAISFYLLLKSEGHPVRDHPVIARLVEIKSLLNKMKQLDDNLPLEIEEILHQDEGAELSKDVLSPSDSEPVSTDDDLSISAKTLETSLPHETAELLKMNSSKNHVNKQEKRKRQDDQVGVQSMEMLRLRANLEEKLKKKGTFSSLVNKPVTTQKHLLQPVNSRLETLDDFADEVTDKDGGTNGRKLSEITRTKSKKPKVVSGDVDLPQRDDIGERRRKHELRVLATAGVKSTEDIGDEDEDFKDMRVESMDADVEEDGEEDDETEESEDEFYKQVKQQRDAKLQAKGNSRNPVVPSTTEIDLVDGKRHISYQMEKNRGLTRKRKKIAKNPRKKYRLNHQKAVVRRKGQVRDVKKPSGPYGGEISGINAGISRSVRFKN